MKVNYNPRQFFEFLGFWPASQSYGCPDLERIEILCRGDRSQLEAFLEPTPFTLVDDRFVVTFSHYGGIDFEDGARRAYNDSAVLFLVECAGERGATVRFEFENSWESVLAGRWLWGYPKHFGEIAFKKGDLGVSGRVYNGDNVSIEASVAFDDTVAEIEWPEFFPHFNVKALPEDGGDSFETFKVLSRDTSADQRDVEIRNGHGYVAFGDGISFRGQRLRVAEVVGARYRVVDFKATSEGTVPRVLAKLEGDRLVLP